MRDIRDRIIAVKRWISRCACLLGLAALPQPAWSYTQYQGEFERIWAGDGGNIWIHLTNGGSAVIFANYPNKTAALSLATTALAARRQVILRYAADGLNCATAGRTNFVGMYML